MIFMQIWDIAYRKSTATVDLGSKINCLAYYQKYNKIVVGSDYLKV